MSSRPNHCTERSGIFFLAMSVSRPSPGDIEHRAGGERAVLDGILGRGHVEARDPGVVDEDIDPAEIGERLCRRALDRGRIRSVDRVLLCGEIPHPDACAGTLEALDDRGADPLQTSGDDGGTPLEIQLVHSLTAPVMPET